MDEGWPGTRRGEGGCGDGAGGEGAERRAEGAASWQTRIITSFLYKSNQHHTARGKSSLATMESSEYCLVKGRWGNKEIYLAHARISTYLSIRSNGLKQSRRRRYGDTYPSSNSANWHPPHHTDFTETSSTPLLLLHSNHSSHRPRRSDHTTGGNNGASGP